MASQTVPKDSEILRVKTIRALHNDEPLTVEGENFLLEDWPRHDPPTIIYWLSKPPPEGCAERPYGRLAEHILPAVEECLVRDWFPLDLVNEIESPLLRDELLEQLRNRLQPRQWVGLLRHADGCRAYLNVARAERRLLAAGTWSGDLSIAATLFDVRRDQVRVEDHLREAIRTSSPSHVPQLVESLNQPGEAPLPASFAATEPQPEIKELTWGDCFSLISRGERAVTDHIGRLQLMTVDELRQELICG